MKNNKSTRKKLNVIKTEAYTKPTKNKKNTVVKSKYSNLNKKTIKQQIKWNIEVYDLVYVNKSIGIVVSNEEYQNSRVETDQYFVYVNDTVIKVFGNYIKKIN